MSCPVPETHPGLVRRTFYVRRGKRIIDVAVALILCLVTLPLQAGIAVLVYITLGRPLRFRQLRCGYRGRPFILTKYRTMTDARSETGRLLPDDVRLTRVGRILRSTSLDELPEIWSIVRGDMSLVGPRPLLVQYMTRYSERQAHRHDVLPGLTGWSQVNGRNDQPWAQKLELDVWYVENISLRLDLSIMWRTVGILLRRRGIALAGHATTAEFRG